MAVIGIGIDLVSIPQFREQLQQPGTSFLKVFTPTERRDARVKTSDDVYHLAARWAVKEAVIKAWSGSRFGSQPVLPENIYHDIEVVTDLWGRPQVRLLGQIAHHLQDLKIHVSLTHDGDVAGAVVVLES